MVKTYAWVVVLAGLALLAPTTQEFVRRYRPAFDAYGQIKAGRNLQAKAGWVWRPTPGWAAAVGVLAMLGIVGMAQVSEFLYFQF